MDFSWLKGLLPAAGGALGSMVAPGIGTALGAGAGSLLGSLWGGGNSRNNQLGPLPQYGMQSGFKSIGMPGGSTAVQMPRFTPEQQSIYQQLAQQAMSSMGNLPSASFEPIKQAAMSQFNQQIVPGIAERFTGMGAGGQRSSAFEQALGSAGAGLSERLAAMQQGFNMQQRQSELGRIMNMLNFGLQPQFEYGITPPGQSSMSSLMGGLGQGAATLIPLMLSKYLGG